MNQSADNIRKSKTLKKHITKAEKEITELEQRKDKLNAQIQDIQDSILELSDDEAQKELGALTSTREVTAGAIQDRHQRIETLQVELAKAKEIEANEARFTELVELTKKGHELMEKHDKVVRWFNEHLEEKLLEYSDTNSEWRQLSNRFRTVSKNMNPLFDPKNKPEGWEGREELHRMRKERKERRKQIIDDIEEEAGQSVQPVLRRFEHMAGWSGPYNGINLNELEEANFNLTELTKGPKRRRNRMQEAKREQPKKDSEAAE
jgi:chromosome segregation ATPase